jgi:hypothetical protein
MRIKQSLLCSLAVVLCVYADAHGQAWSGILSSDRAITWAGNVGIPGGIPNRTSICATINASTYGNDSTDATSAIQSALNSCAANGVVILPAGTYRINGSIRIPSNVVLRGAGANKTILDAHGSGNGVVTFGSGSQPSAGGASITAGATAGSTSITVSSASGISAGSYLMITELNDSSFVTINGTEGACTWCDGSLWSGTRARGQIVEVQSVAGTTVNFLPPLYSAYSHTPLATSVPMGAKYAGVENLQVYANNTGYTSNFYMQDTAYCWIKGVEGNYADGDHVEAYYSYRGEIRDSYFSSAYSHGPGQTDADVFIVSKTTGFLVENNILERLHISLLTNWGAAGNVFGYNYSLANFDTSTSGATPLVGNFSSHGAHPQFNLWEGNVGGSFYPDSVWGSSSHNTFFRNWVLGASQYCNPISNSRSPIQWSSCSWSTQADRAMQIAQYSTYYNFVGNVVGSSQAASVGSEVKQIISPANRNYQGVYGYTFGYGELSDSSGNCSSSSTCAPYTTALIQGDYADADRSTTWASGALTLPASFYRAAQPTFWTLPDAWGTVPWPAIGPDVTGGPGPGGHVYAIPAMVCYNNTPKDSYGLLTFNASTCYVGTAPPPPAAPTNLTAVPH